MSYLTKLFIKKAEKEAIPVASKSGVIYLPIAGETIALKDIEDGVFSGGVLGPGCGIRPTKEDVYAFIDGTIVMIAPTKHAIGIRSDEGIEVLLHIGMDTVEMNGTPFQVAVKVGQRVKCGDYLMSFDQEMIQKAGHPTTSALVITNAKEIHDVQVLPLGERDVVAPCLEVTM